MKYPHNTGEPRRQGKGETPDRPTSSADRSANSTNPAQKGQKLASERGRFDGLYTVTGFTLTRRDGLSLVTCYRTPRGPKDSDRFFVLASSPGRPRVGNLYGDSPSLDGREFDDQVYRYRVERVDADHYRIRTLYRKRPKRRGAG